LPFQESALLALEFFMKPCRFHRSILLSIAFLSSAGAIVSVDAHGQGIHYPINQPLRHSSGAEIDSVDLDGADKGNSAVQASLDNVLRNLGRGYNSFTKRFTGDCVTGTIVGPKPTSFAPSYSIQVIRSYEQFASEMSVEASLSSDFASFSGKVHSKFTQSGSSNATREFLLVRERIVAAPDINVHGAKLAVAAPVAGDTASQRGFYLRCGDQFVSQMQMGGEFIAMLSFSKSESELKSELEVDASASGWGVSASAEFNSKMSSLKQESSLQIDATQIGGKVSSLPEFDLDSLIKYTREFPGQITAETVAPIGVGAPEPYTNLGVDTIDLASAHENFDTVTASSMRAAGRIGQAKDLKLLLARYTVPSARSNGDIIDRTDAQMRSAQDDLAKMNAALKNCATYFWQDVACRFDPRFLDYKPAIPGPIRVAKIDTTHPNSPTNLDIPQNMTLELRGQYCWRGDDNCDADGKWSGDQIGYVRVQSSTVNTPYRGLMPVAKGRVLVQAMDTEYGDNKGDLYAIVY